MFQTRERLERDSVLRTRIDRLEAGLRDHVRWLQEVNRVFVCGGAGDEANSLPEAHLRCSFGQWLHAELAAADDDECHLGEIARLHRDLHDSVRDCLDRRKRGEKLNVATAEWMSGCALRFWNAVRSLQARMSRELAERRPAGAMCAGGFAPAASLVPDNGNIAAQ